MNRNRNIGVASAVFAVIGTPHAWAQDEVTKSYDLAGFDMIDIAGVYELEVEVGSPFSITLTGPKREMSLAKVSVRDGVLYLDREKEDQGIHRDGIDAVITLPNLKALEVSGVVAGEISGVDVDQFNLDLSGVGDLKVSGQCSALEAKVSGVGDLNAEDLQCGEVTVKVSGVGSASVYARQSVDARVTGMGDIEVFGSPEDVRKNGSMFSDITIH
ncbi:head GIN domain-containing protein [Hyphococcus sp. DH-69]|uniref:head GIN domain-containing protein n=1 Tax=Hyphococcus formosus TaxID=3143534 RepID=UPI00398A6373